MSLKVLSKQYNPLFKRKEILVQIDHKQKNTPSRIKVREQIANNLNEKLEKVYIIKMETVTGKNQTLCEVEVFDDETRADKVVHNYLKERLLAKKPVGEKAKPVGEKAKPEGKGKS